MKDITFSPLLVFLAILFSVSLVVSNFLETKLLYFWGISATGGLILFPISYIINDVIVEIWGLAKTKFIIWTGFAMSLFVFLITRLVLILPAASFWDGEEHFNYIFNLTPRIALASMLAFLVGSFVNAIVMNRMKQRNGRFSTRAILSTLVGETVDSLIFFPIAFIGIIPLDEMAIFMLTQIALKSLYEILILPITIRLIALIKRLEARNLKF